MLVLSEEVRGGDWSAKQHSKTAMARAPVRERDEKKDRVEVEGKTAQGRRRKVMKGRRRKANRQTKIGPGTKLASQNSAAPPEPSGSNAFESQGHVTGR